MCQQLRRQINFLPYFPADKQTTHLDDLFIRPNVLSNGTHDQLGLGISKISRKAKARKLMCEIEPLDRVRGAMLLKVLSPCKISSGRHIHHAVRTSVQYW
jgi:hypothetical protein